MNLTNLVIATTALLLFNGCSQKSEDVTDVPEQVAEATDNVTAMFTTAALIDPNSASAGVIAAIPGVGTDLAQRIVSGRPYATPTALHDVLKDAVDESALKTIYTAMFVKVDLNTGSDADYRLIPSTMSPGKLAHEFEEYRPYSSMDQFSREMSKYVSAEEVAFLRRYVTIN